MLFDHLIAENAFAQGLVILLELRFGRGVVFGHRSQLLFLERANQFVALGLGMLRGIESIGRAAHRSSTSQSFVISLVKLRRRHLALRLAGFAAQFADGGANFLDFGVGEFDGIDDRLFFYFFCAGLDHHDRFGGADDHDVEQAFAHFRVGGIGDEAAIDQADAHCADRTEERNVGNGQARPRRR